MLLEIDRGPETGEARVSLHWSSFPGHVASLALATCFCLIPCVSFPDLEELREHYHV
jgi:hypothetical protein